ncbi:RagB/SusD family nutrient uptake outer membrane protein [Bacteroidales bacterium OttesenSCG-928-L03]|nr:RagB/SusD family nutrient uptake outer membrane protein [Bacteroidales bacterium OttesenSCG-928-L03]
MKKYIIIVFSLLFMFGATSCDDWLDLRPENDIVLEDFWRTKSDVESVLAACYRSFSERAVIERMIVWGELRSDNMVNGRSFPGDKPIYDMNRILDGNLTQYNSYANWSSFYSIINTCNVLLHYAPLVLKQDENFSQRDLNLVKGETLTLRALAYFYLVRAFRDIPLITDPSIDDTQNYAVFQNTEEEVLDQIVADLNEVLSNNWVRDSYGDKEYDKGRITRSAVNALLADVYLWKEDYANCIKACDEVLSNTNLKLITNAEQMYSQIFYFKNSTESIFEIQFNDKDMKNDAIPELYSSLENRTGYLTFPTRLGYNSSSQNAYTGPYSPFNYKISGSTESVDDIRSWSFIFYNGGDIYTIFKYAGTSAYKMTTGGNTTYRYGYSSNRTCNWIIYRLTDIMLLKAEAMVQQEADWEETISLVNQVYQRSNPDDEPLNPASYSSKKDREELVLRERHRELLFEGKRWFDLVRIARRENSVANLNKFAVSKRQDSPAPLGARVMDAIYMPILKGELDANTNLKQNPYYEETSTSER